MKSKMIMIDFDGTIVDHQFPLIGNPMPHAFEVMRDLKAAGHKLILWTCREDEKRPYLTDAVNFCRENGVEFDAVNEGIHEEDFRPESSPRRKPYCHYFIDDRNVGGLVDWLMVRRIILESEKVQLVAVKDQE